MQRILSRGLIVVVLAGILYACNLSNASSGTQPSLLSEVPALGLAVQAQSGTYNTVGQVINFQYIVNNTGGTVLAGPVTISDNKATATCPAVNTIGNNDNNLDPGELLTCTSSYSITQVDLNAGLFTSTVTASAGGLNSTTVTNSVQMTRNSPT